MAPLWAALQDGVSSYSPWCTQIVIDNACATSLRVYLCRDADNPSAANAVEHVVPGQQRYGINSGWINEPRATLLIRTGVDEARVLRMAHAAKLRVDLAAEGGYAISTNDDVIEEDYPDPGSVPNNDTVPMVTRAQSFLDRAPGSAMVHLAAAPPSATRQLRDMVSASSPFNTTVSVENNTNAPVKIFLCRNPEEPSPQDAVDHTVQARSTLAINSGYLTEPRATLLMRTGMHEAMVFRMPHFAQLKLDVAEDGLKVTSFDDVEFEAYPDPGSVPNFETVPMVVKEKSFMECRPGQESRPRGVTTPSRQRRPDVPPQFFEHQENAPSAMLFGSPGREGFEDGHVAAFE